MKPTSCILSLCVKFVISIISKRKITAKYSFNYNKYFFYTDGVNQLLILSTVHTFNTTKFYSLHCVFNHCCHPHCDFCWSNYTFSWYRNNISLNKYPGAYNISANGDTFNMTFAPDGLSYRCESSPLDKGFAIVSNNFWCKYINA